MKLPQEHLILQETKRASSFVKLEIIFLLLSYQLDPLRNKVHQGMESYDKLCG